MGSGYCASGKCACMKAAGSSGLLLDRVLLWDCVAAHAPLSLITRLRNTSTWRAGARWERQQHGGGEGGRQQAQGVAGRQRGVAGPGGGQAGRQVATARHTYHISLPRYRLVCNCYPDPGPGGGLPMRTWPGTIQVPRPRVSSLSLLLFNTDYNKADSGMHACNDDGHVVIARLATSN